MGCMLCLPGGIIASRKVTARSASALSKKTILVAGTRRRCTKHLTWLLRKITTRLCRHTREIFFCYIEVLLSVPPRRLVLAMHVFSHSRQERTAHLSPTSGGKLLSAFPSVARRCARKSSKCGNRCAKSIWVHCARLEFPGNLKLCSHPCSGDAMAWSGPQRNASAPTKMQNSRSSSSFSILLCLSLIRRRLQRLCLHLLRLPHRRHGLH